jgi:mono/diheme cytochrome c family protein
MQRKTLFAAVTLCATLALPALAADANPTFYRDVLPVLQENCQECHRPAGANYGGMRAPMSFVSFEETRPWARSIAKQVQSGEMPPWGAHPMHKGVFRNERVLEPDEVDTLLSWAKTGADAGDPADAPPTAEFQSVGGWLIGEPDLVVTMGEAYTVRDEVEDIYTAFSVDLTPEMLPEPRWVTAFQCKPDSDAIHHFNLHLLRPDENGELPPPRTVAESDRISPEQAGNYMGGTSSGTDANAYREGYGFLLEPGMRVTFDIHYHKEVGPGRLGSGIQPLMQFTFAIPPNEPNYKVGPLTTVLENDVDLLALHPHMHMRGKAAKFEAFYPDGTSEVLLDVPNFDFSWQIVYYFNEIKRLPKGTRFEYTAWYDNSPEKAEKYGFDSNRTVRFGQPSTDEMVMGFTMSSQAVDAAAPTSATGGH